MSTVSGSVPASQSIPDPESRARPGAPTVQKWWKRPRAGRFEPVVVERPAGASVQEKTGRVAKLLRVSGVAVMVYSASFLVNFYLTLAAVGDQMVAANRQLEKDLRALNVNSPFANPAQGQSFNLPPPPPGPSPLMATLTMSAGWLAMYGACVVFLFVAAGKIERTSSRGLAWTGIIIALFLGVGLPGTMVISSFAMSLHGFAIIHLLVDLGTAALLVFTGSTGIAVMRQPDVKQAFDAAAG